LAADGRLGRTFRPASAGHPARSDVASLPDLTVSRPDVGGNPLTSAPAESGATVERHPESGAADARPAASASRYDAGTVLADRYRLMRRLGGGGSADVWVAHDGRLDRCVAIKLLHQAAARGRTEQERLRREARVLARLAHPHVTAVLDLIEDDDPTGGLAPVLVTELLTGEDLGARLNRGALGLAETLTVCAQLADALDAAHRAGVIHRDVKPANIMLTPSGVKLLDFGIARTAAESELTGAAAIGTPACMAPEQWLGRRVEPATDLYGLGCVLYWCLEGQAPFADRVLPALAVAHIEYDPPPLPDRWQSPEIDALYRACLAKDPAGRPSAREAATVLGRAEVSRTAPAVGLADGGHRAPATRRTAFMAASAGCLVVVAAAIAIPLAVSSASQPAAPPTSSTAAVSSPGAGAGRTPQSSAAGPVTTATAALSGTPANPAVAGAPSPATHPKKKHTPPGQAKH
jgi:serine/threonine-protein kinase